MRGKEENKPAANLFAKSGLQNRVLGNLAGEAEILASQSFLENFPTYGLGRSWCVCDSKALYIDDPNCCSF